MNTLDKPRRQVDPSWWTRHELRAALAERDVSAVYRFLHQRGFSQSRIAALTGQNQSEVSAILTHGRQVNAYDVLARIADGLSISRGLMGLAYTTVLGLDTDAATTEDRDVKRRDFMGIAAKITMGATLATTDLAILAAPATAGPVPDHIGPTDIRQVEEMTTALNQQDMALGGGSCREAIVGYLNWAVELRKSTMTDDVRRELDRALADLENLAGWTSYDMLLHNSAQRFYLRSVYSAKQANDPARVAWGLSKLGMVHWQAGHYGDAMHMIRLATGPAEEAGSMRLAASIWQKEAMVFARIGNLRETAFALNRAIDDYSRAEPDPPAWLALTLNEAELHGTTATAYTDLANSDPALADRAIESAKAALRFRADESHYRRALIVECTKLALNAYRSGETDLANQTTSQVIDALPQVSSRRLANRLQPLAIEAATHDSTATDLAHQLSSLSTR